MGQSVQQPQLFQYSNQNSKAVYVSSDEWKLLDKADNMVLRCSFFRRKRIWFQQTSLEKGLKNQALLPLQSEVCKVEQNLIFEPFRTWFAWTRFLCLQKNEHPRTTLSITFIRWQLLTFGCSLILYITLLSRLAYYLNGTWLSHYRKCWIKPLREAIREYMKITKYWRQKPTSWLKINVSWWDFPQNPIEAQDTGFSMLLCWKFWADYYLLTYTNCQGKCRVIGSGFLPFILMVWYFVSFTILWPHIVIVFVLVRLELT